MTKNEALKAAIDGKKITHPSFNDGSHVYFNGSQFMRSCIDPENDFPIKDSMNRAGGYEIVPEHVDFATAWKAYEEGKAIQSVDGDQSGEINVYHKLEKKYFGLCVDAWEIRGKWIILDD